MTEMHLDRFSMERRLTELAEKADDLNAVLDAMPGVPDGGEASALITFIATAGAEAAGVVADTHHALIAVTKDVLADLHLTEDQILEHIRDLETEIEKQ